jgi:hypothetical protein
LKTDWSRVTIRSDVDAEAGVVSERDLAGRNVEKARGQGPGAGEGAELNVLRDAMRRRTQGIEGVKRGTGTSRERADARAVEVCGLGGPGEVGLAEFGRVKGHEGPSPRSA